MGLRVKVRNNGRDSFKQQTLKEINDEREKEMSEIGMEDTKRIPPYKTTYLEKSTKFTSEKNFPINLAPKLVRNSFEDEYQDRFTLNRNADTDKYSVPIVQRTNDSSEHHIFIRDDDTNGQNH